MISPQELLESLNKRSIQIKNDIVNCDNKDELDSLRVKVIGIDHQVHDDISKIPTYERKRVFETIQALMRYVDIRTNLLDASTFQFEGHPVAPDGAVDYSYTPPPKRLKETKPKPKPEHETNALEKSSARSTRASSPRLKSVRSFDVGSNRDSVLRAPIPKRDPLVRAPSPRRDSMSRSSTPKVPRASSVPRRDPVPRVATPKRAEAPSPKIIVPKRADKPKPTVNSRVVSAPSSTTTSHPSGPTLGGKQTTKPIVKVSTNPPKPESLPKPRVRASSDPSQEGESQTSEPPAEKTTPQSTPEGGDQDKHPVDQKKSASESHTDKPSVAAEPKEIKESGKLVSSKETINNTEQNVTDSAKKTAELPESAPKTKISENVSTSSKGVEKDKTTESVTAEKEVPSNIGVNPTEKKNDSPQPQERTDQVPVERKTSIDEVKASAKSTTVAAETPERGASKPQESVDDQVKSPQLSSWVKDSPALSKVTSPDPQGNLSQLTSPKQPRVQSKLQAKLMTFEQQSNSDTSETPKYQPLKKQATLQSKIKSFEKKGDDTEQNNAESPVLAASQPSQPAAQQSQNPPQNQFSPKPIRINPQSSVQSMVQKLTQNIDQSHSVPTPGSLSGTVSKNTSPKGFTPTKSIHQVLEEGGAHKSVETKEFPTDGKKHDNDSNLKLAAGVRAQKSEDATGDVNDVEPIIQEQSNDPVEKVDDSDLQNSSVSESDDNDNNEKPDTKDDVNVEMVDSGIGASREEEVKDAKSGESTTKNEDNTSSPKLEPEATTSDEPVTKEVPEATSDKSVTKEVPEATSDESVTKEGPEATDESVTKESPESTDDSVTKEVPETTAIANTPVTATANKDVNSLFDTLDYTKATLKEETSHNQHILFSNVTNSVVSHGEGTSPYSAHIKQGQHSVIMIDAQGPIFIHDLTHCVLILKCHQLRLHNIHNSLVLVEVSNDRIVIENCDGLKVGNYPIKKQGFESAKDKLEVDDFNWPTKLEKNIHFDYLSKTKYEKCKVKYYRDWIKKISDGEINEDLLQKFFQF